MRLTDASVAIRPRSAWEAMDLGVRLARRHAGLLMASWAVITLPVFILLNLVLWQFSNLTLFIIWLLKPAFERLPLYILSRALFGDTPTLKQALRAYPRLLKSQLLASLTWRRFSPSRSFDLPVLQLEGLSGQARAQRLVVLGQRDAGGATWLTVIGMHLEVALWFSLFGLLYLMLPKQMVVELDWQKLIEANAAPPLWLDVLSNFFYVLVLVVWEPIYVACGFTLYLNRRTALEGWDIELQFRRLRQRLIGSAYALLLGFALLLAQAPQQAMAAHDPAPQTDPTGPEAERLTHQALTSKAARQEIHALLDAPPFQNRQTVTRWHLSDDKAELSAKPKDVESWARFFDNLFRLVEYAKNLEAPTLVIKALLWSLLFSLLILLLWRYRDWLNAFAQRLGLPQRQPREVPTVLFGLELAPESLPDDIAAEAERLWANHPREALGLLYRALLSRLLHDFRLPLRQSHTEGEVLRLVQRLDHIELQGFSQTLTSHWQNLAYGHRLPADELRQGLCDGWRRLFAVGSPA